MNKDETMWVNNDIALDKHMTWNKFLEEENKKEYYQLLKEFVKTERKTKEVFPASPMLFNHFKYTPVDKVCVVILATEPYPIDINDGLAWSVNHPQGSPALDNIKEEIRNDWAPMFKNMDDIFKTNLLIQWAQQGVLLHNVRLTVEKNKPGSHKKKGWEMFTGNMLQMLSLERKNVVYMLWGKAANEMRPYINEQNNLVLTATHPHPKMASQGGWFGQRHFTKTDAHFKKLWPQGKVVINWFLL